VTITAVEQLRLFLLVTAAKTKQKECVHCVVKLSVYGGISWQHYPQEQRNFPFLFLSYCIRNMTHRGNPFWSKTNRDACRLSRQIVVQVPLNHCELLLKCFHFCLQLDDELILSINFWMAFVYPFVFQEVEPAVCLLWKLYGLN
jgi:hypothetical protein